MNHREKILAALNHKPGPVAVDIGSTGVPSTHPAGTIWAVAADDAEVGV